MTTYSVVILKRCISETAVRGNLVKFGSWNRIGQQSFIEEVRCGVLLNFNFTACLGYDYGHYDGHISFKWVPLFLGKQTNIYRTVFNQVKRYGQSWPGIRRGNGKDWIRMDQDNFFSLG